MNGGSQQIGPLGTTAFHLSYLGESTTSQVFLDEHPGAQLGIRVPVNRFCLPFGAFSALDPKYLVLWGQTSGYG